MAATSYSVSWLYGEFRIARLNRGKVEARWEAPKLVESPNDLIQALDDASAEIDLSSKGDVTVVHEHDLHTHDYLEVPLMKKRDLEKYLQRRVNQDKSFEDDAAWCYHKVKHQGGKQGVLLHLLPKWLVDGTVSACTVVGLAPKKYVPLTEIVSAYLPTTEFKSEDLVVVVARFKERTEIILAMGNGEALFVRELIYGIELASERLVSDINRTIRYTRQQLGRGVDCTFLMGSFETTEFSSLVESIETPVSLDANAADPYFWAEHGDKLTGKLSANFISVFTQNNITADVFRRFGVWATAITVTAALLMTITIGALVAQRADQIVSVTARTQTVQQKIQELEEKLAIGKKKQDHLNRLQASSHNLPSLLMVHLSDLAPAELTFTNVDISKGTDGWSVTLKGNVPGDLRYGARVLANFEAKLRNPPWSLRFYESFTDSWMQQFSQGKLSGLEDTGFSMKGDLQ